MTRVIKILKHPSQLHRVNLSRVFIYYPLNYEDLDESDLPYEILFSSGGEVAECTWNFSTRKERDKVLAEIDTLHTQLINNQ